MSREEKRELAQNNLRFLQTAQNAHNQIEAERIKHLNEVGGDYEPEDIEVRLVVPDQPLLDPNRSTFIRSINPATMTILVTHYDDNGRGILINIHLSEITMIGICGKELQKRMLEKSERPDPNG